MYSLLIKCIFVINSLFAVLYCSDDDGNEESDSDFEGTKPVEVNILSVLCSVFYTVLAELNGVKLS